MERRQPAARSELHLASKVRERSERHRQPAAASVVVETSDSVAPKGTQCSTNPSRC